MQHVGDLTGSGPTATADHHRLRANPELIVVQSRLLSPRYAGPGKWAIFDPRTLRSFVAATPDNSILPPVLQLLAKAAPGAAADAIAAALPGMAAAAINGLKGRGLLVDADNHPPRAHGFLGRC